MVDTSKDGMKTPKYTIVKELGFYPAIQKLVGRDGKISMYLKPQINENKVCPPLRLQAKNSLNFTGLKGYYLDGKPSGFAWGYPPFGQTYSKDNKVNPFSKVSDDCFLFLVHMNEAYTKPKQIELFVLSGCKNIGSLLFNQLKGGGFDDDLRVMRNKAAYV